jgi:mRNA-degrading endonuclease toxin of MazEF toxin-antitoxin module
MPRYVPEAGDIVWLNFTPQAGHEQAGHRPALVLSPASYNEKTSLLTLCFTAGDENNLEIKLRKNFADVFAISNSSLRCWSNMVKKQLKDLTAQEILALAIQSEEEDGQGRSDFVPPPE